MEAKATPADLSVTQVILALRSYLIAPRRSWRQHRVLGSIGQGEGTGCPQRCRIPHPAPGEGSGGELDADGAAVHHLPTRPRPALMSSPMPTISGGKKRPPTTSGEPTCAGRRNSGARGYRSWSTRRSRHAAGPSRADRADHPSGRGRRPRPRPCASPAEPPTVRRAFP